MTLRIVAGEQWIRPLWERVREPTGLPSLKIMHHQRVQNLPGARIQMTIHTRKIIPPSPGIRNSPAPYKDSAFNLTAFNQIRRSGTGNP